MLDTILGHLPRNFPHRDKITWFDTIDSTNTAAKSIAAQGAPHGTVLIADRQTGGRGRMGRSFHSPSGQGIYLSMILRPNCPAAQLMHLTCAVGVAMCDALEASVGLRPGIKWTNDLVCGTRKLGGILTELSLDAQGNVAFAVIGVGVNCCQSEGDFPEDIRNIAISLSQVAGAPVDRGHVAAAMLAALDAMADTLLTGRETTLQQYRKDCVTLGKEISVVTPTLVRHGTAVGIDSSGALLVDFSDGHREAISAGEVSIRGMYGYL